MVFFDLLADGNAVVSGVIDEDLNLVESDREVMVDPLR